MAAGSGLQYVHPYLQPVGGCIQPNSNTAPVKSMPCKRPKSCSNKWGRDSLEIHDERNQPESAALRAADAGDAAGRIPAAAQRTRECTRRNRIHGRTGHAHAG